MEQFATTKAQQLTIAILGLETAMKRNAELADALAKLETEYRGHTHSYAKTKVNFVNASCGSCASQSPQFGGWVSYIYGLTSADVATTPPSAPH